MITVRLRNDGRNPKIYPLIYQGGNMLTTYNKSIWPDCPAPELEPVHDVIICPWCLGLTGASGEEITVCQCCNNPIREEDVNNDEED